MRTRCNPGQGLHRGSPTAPSLGMVSPMLGSRKGLRGQLLPDVCVGRAVVSGEGVSSCRLLSGSKHLRSSAEEPQAITFWWLASEHSTGDAGGRGVGLGSPSLPLPKRKAQGGNGGAFMRPPCPATPLSQSSEMGPEGSRLQGRGVGREGNKASGGGCHPL